MYKTRLRELRERIGITQKEIADLLNINASHYGHLENEDEIIPLKHLNTLCNYFNVSFDYVFEFTNTRQYKDSINEINLIKSGSRLKEFRKKEKLTQDKLAQKLNVARTIISKYEKGEFLISTHALYTICKKYHISADYLLGKVDIL